MKAVRATACDDDGPAVKGSSPVLSIVHSHHLDDEGGSGRPPTARCDGDGPDRILPFDTEELSFPALSVVHIMVGERCDIPAASGALQTPEISATEAPDPDISGTSMPSKERPCVRRPVFFSKLAS